MTSPSNLTHAGCFIALEGIDGSGKSTQARLLTEALRAEGHAVVLTREPGGTELGERLRTMVLDATLACAPRAELLLLLAARAQHVATVIAPALGAGQFVVTDRFSLSSLAYQGYGRGLPLAEIRAADATATGGLQPDLTLVIDVPLDTVFARIGTRQDRFEGEGREFLQRVADGYRALSETDPAIRRIDGAGNIAAIQAHVRRAVDELMRGDDR